jgi:hypothetical protein
MEVMTFKVTLIIPKWTLKFLTLVQLVKRLLDLDAILYRGDDIDGDLDAIFFNHTPSTFQNDGRLNF